MLHEEDSFWIKFRYQGANEMASFVLAPSGAEPIPFTLMLGYYSEQFEIDLAPFSFFIEDFPALPLQVAVVDSRIVLDLEDEPNGWIKILDEPQRMLQTFRNDAYDVEVAYVMDGIVIVGTIDFGGGQPRH